MLKKSMRWLSAVTIALITGATNAATVELLNNGGFETGDFTSWTPIPIDGTLSVDGTNPSSGSWSARLQNSNNSTSIGTNTVIQQFLSPGTVSNGQELTLSFDMRGTTANSGLLFANMIYLDDGGTTNQLFGPHFGEADPNTWMNYSYTFNAGNVGNGLVLELSAPCGAVAGCVNDIFVDNVSLSYEAVVPVPAAVWLFGSGLIGLVGVARRNA